MANQQTNQTANQQLKDQLDSYKSRITKSRKRKRIAYIVGLCLVAVAIVGLVVPAATLEYGKTYCGQEEHTHTDVCVNRTLVCALPDTSNGNGHVHVPSCYDDSSTLAICGKTPVAHMHIPACVNAAGTELICGQEEDVHMHTLACVDEATNTYKCGAEDLPHVHGVTCYSLGADGSYVLVCNQPSVGHVHTMLCLDPETGEVICGQEEAIELEHVHTDACYDEELICGMEEHVHNELCYDEITEAIMKKDEESSAAKEAAEEAEGIEDGVAEGDLTAEEITEAKDQGLLFENDDVIVVFDVPEKIKDDIVLMVTETDEEVEFVEAVDATEEVNAEGEPVDDEAAQDGDNGEPVFFSEEGEEAEGDGTDAGVDESDEPVDAVDSANETLIVQPEEEPAYKINLRIEATLNGEPVDDIEALGLTAKLQMKPRVIAPILSEIDYAEVAPEVKNEVGAEITVLQQPDNSQAASISEIRSEQVDEVVVTSVQEATTTFDVVAAVFTARVNNTPNAEFTVEYVAPIETPLLGSSGQLKIIDTEDDLDGKVNGKLTPTNDKDPKTKWLTLNNGKVVMNTDLKPIYKSKTFKYYKAPTLDHFDTVESKSYELSKITVTTDGVPTDYDPDVHFTNRSESAGVHNGVEYALIKDKRTTIKLIYNPRKSDPSFKSSFYDYDITDGYIYNSETGARTQNPNNQRVTSLQGLDNWAYTRYANTLQKGINSNDNYSGKGTKLAFGNVNTGTSLGNAKWNSNLLNMYNYGTYEGCTFGLVTGLSGGKIQYASNVSAPNLFNEGNALGKTSYDDGQLTFKKLGDTFTLSSASVGGNTVSGLNTFGHPGNYTSIWTNNFWPLDNTGSYGTDNHDLKFGSSSSNLVGKRKFVGTSQDYSAKNGTSGSKPGTANFPKSDDGLDHNSYFGLRYEVEFTLDKDYIGPLQYLFFGDDDLWIFLDDKLVVDIGGVHSSVGEYVNLWDYLEKGSEGKHKLSIFYTERGASGSTCYMNFTLPSVTGTTIDQKTGEIKIMKEVTAPVGSSALTDDEFNFEIELKDGKGNNLVDDYSYTRYDKDDEEVESNLIVWDGGNFILKNGEYVIIKHLPVDTQYTVHEILGENEPYQVTWDYYIDGRLQPKLQTKDISGLPGEAPYFTGIVENNTTEYKVRFLNTVPPELPATGGEGAYWYWIGGGLLVTLALLMLWRRQTLAAVPASQFTKTEASILAFFGDTNFASPSGKPESVYSKGWSRAGKGDESTRKGGRY